MPCSAVGRFAHVYGNAADGPAQRGRYLLSLPDFIVTTRDGGDPEPASLVGLLVADLSQAGPGTEATRSALLDLLLVHVLRGWLRAHPGPDWPLVKDPAVVAALRHIHREPHRPWPVSRGR